MCASNIISTVWTLFYSNMTMSLCIRQGSKTHHQTPMTCTYGFSHFRHFQNCSNRDEIQFLNTWIMFPSLLPQILEVHFSVLKKGCQYFCLYSVCTSHWCLVMSFWTLSYTQRHCHVRIEKSPNCCYNIRSTQFPRISLYALTLRFVLIEITKVVKPVH